jgi:Sulfatase
MAVVVFWWGFLFVVQGAERLFLVREAVRVEPPTPGLLIQTLLTGAWADLMLATLGIAVAAASAALATAPAALIWRRRERVTTWFRVAVRACCGLVGVLFLLVLTVDMGYYGYNRQHLDTVFFEYVDEMLSRAPVAAERGASSSGSRQALEQTRAELGDARKWAVRVGVFAGLQAGVIAGWWWLFRRRLRPALERWRAHAPAASATVFGVCFVAGATGLHAQGPLAVARVGISSTTYYALAQSPMWQTAEEVFFTLSSNQQTTRAHAEALMALPKAVALTRQALAPDTAFVSDEYPLVHARDAARAVGAPRRLNVLLIFVEALDRRFIGPSYSPFLERWGRDAIVFENFFSNGTLTHHGLFASLCSHLTGFGKSPIKIRYANDYLCLPEMLRRAGYTTEMVIGYNRDHHQDHTALFLARNGVRQFLDEGNFPPTAERLGLGLTDGALFEQVRGRVATLRRAQPYFLTTLTLSMHHPFPVPVGRPEVTALATDADRYPALLRYTDGELERLLTGLERDGLLDDTLVLVLGDHGRHEVLGHSHDEQWLGHHLTRLYVWMPPALRASTGFRPRHVETVASHVDLAPTLLGLTGLTPRLSPFMGADLSCVIVADCQPPGHAVLMTTHNVALAGDGRILTYGIKSRRLRTMDLALGQARDVEQPGAAELAAVERLKALVVSSTLLVEENRVWSWARFGERAVP